MSELTLNAKVISPKELFKIIEGCINHGADNPIIVWCDMPDFLSKYAKPHCDPWQFAINLASHYPSIIANVDHPGSPLTNHKIMGGDVIRRIGEEEYYEFATYDQIKFDENSKLITKLFLHAPISYTEVEVGLNSFEYAKQLMDNLHLPAILMYNKAYMTMILGTNDLSGFNQYLCVDEDSPFLNKD